LTMAEPLKVGLIVGREWSMPPALIEAIRARNAGVIAEFVKLGGTRMNEPVPYRVIVDRISHEVPYYRTYLKNAALQGVKVVNDPFMWSADDKFFGASLAVRIGVASPKTLVLPNKDYVPGIVHNESLRNLMYPLDWDWIISYVGMPCVLKDAHGGGWKDVYVVHSKEELLARYNQSGTLTMILQEFIQWDEYARCMVLGQERVHVMRYDPRTRYYAPEHGFSTELYTRLLEDSLKLCRALGYDMNTCEFAIKDGVPYAIDFMNCAPDMDIYSLGEVNFRWCVQNMAEMCIAFAKGEAMTADRYTWRTHAKVTRNA
jgi:glutathione synthase/RimK-type ligase-like ATP-grasp enzyme